MTLRRLSRGNEFGKKDNEETDLFILKRYPVPPSTPKGLTPNADSDPVSTTGTVFRATAFQDPDARDGRNFAHESHWQVASGNQTEDFQKPIQEAWRAPKSVAIADKETRGTASHLKLMSPRRLLMQRSADHQLFWRVRYRDENCMVPMVPPTHSQPKQIESLNKPTS